MISFLFDSPFSAELVTAKGARSLGPAPPVETSDAGSGAKEIYSLDGEMSYDDIFSIVKKTVRKVTGKERAGLGLALSDLPSVLGAFWQVGGNYIVMNETLVVAMKSIAKSQLEFNSFVYTILTHEYLHSVGYIEEEEARRMTAKVTHMSLGPSHPASVMSDGDLWSLYPQLRYVRGGNGSTLRIVSNFDSDSTSYIA